MYEEVQPTDSQKERTKRRLAICSECEHFNKVIKLCRKCRCFIPLKSRFEMNSCPIGKW